MPKSTKLSAFPDINVWVALTHARHVHYRIASDWFADVGEDSRFFFSRFTQLGLLRLLTSESVMGIDVMSQRDAWTAYDGWLRDDRIQFLDEPHGIEERFRALTRRQHPATKDWTDSYLTAFADASRLTLVTFDRGLSSKAQSVVVLSESRDQ